MAEENDNKTEPATARRRQEARESGQVARSADLTAGALLVVGLIVLSLTGPAFINALATIMWSLLSADGTVSNLYAKDEIDPALRIEPKTATQ